MGFGSFCGAPPQTPPKGVSPFGIPACAPLRRLLRSFYRAPPLSSRFAGAGGAVHPSPLSMGLRPKPRQRERLPLESPRVLACGVCCVLSTERRPFFSCFAGAGGAVRSFYGAPSQASIYAHKDGRASAFRFIARARSDERGAAPLPCLFCCPRRFYRRLPGDGSSCRRSVCTRRPLSARPSATPTPPCTNRLNGSAASAGATPYNTLSKAK